MPSDSRRTISAGSVDDGRSSSPPAQGGGAHTPRLVSGAWGPGGARTRMLLRLLRNEIAKAVRMRLPYFGLACSAILGLLIFIAISEVGQGDVANGWGYVCISMQLIFTDIGLICVMVFSTMLVAEETRSGTVRPVLSAPIYRWQWYVAKVLIGLLYMLVLSVTSLVLSIILATVHYDFGDVIDSLGLVYGWDEVLLNFLLALALSWLGLAVLVLYGIFLSTVIRRPGAAVAAGIGTVYLLDFTKHLVHLDPYIATKYIGYPWQVLHQVTQGVDYQWTPEIWRMLGLCFVTCVVAFGVGLTIFRRQDLND